MSRTPRTTPAGTIRNRTGSLLTAGFDQGGIEGRHALPLALDGLGQRITRLEIGGKLGGGPLQAPPAHLPGEGGQTLVQGKSGPRHAGNLFVQRDEVFVVHVSPGLKPVRFLARWLDHPQQRGWPLREASTFPGGARRLPGWPCRIGPESLAAE